ncbi:MAG: hypothetical protein AAF220_09195 [Pseudomonadota bacterium]
MPFSISWLFKNGGRGQGASDQHRHTAGGRLALGLTAGAIGLSLAVAAPQSSAQTNDGQAPTINLGNTLNLDLSNLQTYETNAPRFAISFSGYSVSLDLAGEEVVSIIAELAQDTRSPLVEIVANPDGVAADRDDLAGTRALNVQYALVRAGLPKTTKVTIVKDQRGALPSSRGQSGLLQEDQRVEVVVHEPRR